MASLQRDPRQSTILVIDDEESMRHMLSLMLSNSGYNVETAASGQDGLEIIRADEEIRIVLCDLRMPQMDGLGFVRRARRLRTGIIVIVMSAYGTTDTAIEAVKRGAYDFVSKPFRSDEIVLTLRKVEERERLARENAVLREEVARQRRLSSSMVGAAGGLRLVAEAARKVASAPSTVLITGESGSGKEVLARSIHELSPRAKMPFVAINCAAIPENLLESELFGHERGAFTGAVRTRPGLFEQADKGTLLLDEIGEMPLHLQVKLLRVIEGGHLRRLGGNKDIPVDVRLLAATAQDLPELVRTQRFRQDLYYRLNVVGIHMPLLRERREDIPLLVDHFLTIHAARLGRSKPRISPEAMRILEEHPWPGNVRQLENACERALLLGDGSLLSREDLPPELLEGMINDQAESPGWDLSIKRRVPELEKRLIARALDLCGGNRSKAAPLLEISYKALLYKIREYGLD